MFRIYAVILILMFSSLPGRGDVLPEMEEVKLLASNPNVIGSIATNRYLQFWFLSSNGRADLVDGLCGAQTAKFMMMLCVRDFIIQPKKW